MITKEKNRTKIICAVVTAISAIVAGGSAFQLYRGTSGNPPAFCNSAIPVSYTHLRKYQVTIKLNMEYQQFLDCSLDTDCSAEIGA